MSPLVWFRAASAGALLGSALLLGGGCVIHEHPAYEAAPGGYYDYYYYPQANVYYDPSGGNYYWNREGRWEPGRRLPEHYRLEGSHYEQYRSRSREPWAEHEQREHEHGRD